MHYHLILITALSPPLSGLKPGQRKVLYTCFKRNDKREVKVAQLAGSVAEHSAYHHGEVRVTSTSYVHTPTAQRIAV